MDRTSPVIDFHVHFLVREVLEQCLPHAVATNRGQHQLPPHLFALFEKMMTPQGVIDDMNRLQIDMSVISSATVIEPTYWAEPDRAKKRSSILARHRALAQFRSRKPLYMSRARTVLDRQSRTIVASNCFTSDNQCYFSPEYQVRYGAGIGR